MWSQRWLSTLLMMPQFIQLLMFSTECTNLTIQWLQDGATWCTPVVVGIPITMFQIWSLRRSLTLTNSSDTSEALKLSLKEKTQTVARTPKIGKCFPAWRRTLAWKWISRLKLRRERSKEPSLLAGMERSQPHRREHSKILLIEWLLSQTHKNRLFLTLLKLYREEIRKRSQRRRRKKRQRNECLDNSRNNNII